MSDYEFDDEDPDIIIRRIEPVPLALRGFKGSKYYYVEIYAEPGPWPEGIGIVVDHAGLTKYVCGSLDQTAEALLLRGKDWVYISYLFVLDKFRRRGCGTRILKACMRRWPNIAFESMGDDEAGQLLIDKTVGREPAEAREQ